jgi:HEAT repeat protein
MHSCTTAVPDLIALLKSTDQGTRQWAAEALGGIGPEAREAVGPLIRLLKGNDQAGWWNAAFALGKIGPEAKEAVPALLDVLRNPGGLQDTLRQGVIEALDRIDPEAAAKVERP